MVQRKSMIDPDLIRELAKLLDETGLTEIEFERDGERVRVGRLAQPAAVPAATAIPAAERPPAATEGRADPMSHPGLVTSPMVGTAYAGPQPGARPFVETGSRVSPGDT